MYSKILIASVTLNVVALVVLLLNIIPSHKGVLQDVISDAPLTTLFHILAQKQEANQTTKQSGTEPSDDVHIQNFYNADGILRVDYVRESRASSERAVRGQTRSRREQRAILEDGNGGVYNELLSRNSSSISYEGQHKMKSAEERWSSPVFLSRKNMGANISEFASSPLPTAITLSPKGKKLWRSYNASMPLSGPGTLLSLPVFLKFHKVGGTTIAACLRDREEAGDFGEHNYWCCDALWQETEEREKPSKGLNRRRSKRMRQVDQATDYNSRRSRALTAEASSCASGGEAYEHNTLPIFKEHGFRGFQVCTEFRPRVRALVVLRNPVTKWLSGLYYWGKVYTNPQGRICLARKFYEDLRLDIAEAYRRLVQDPHQVEARDVDLMSACLYGDRFVETQELSRTAMVEKAERDHVQGQSSSVDESEGAFNVTTRAFMRMRVERYFRARAVQQLPLVDEFLETHVGKVGFDTSSKATSHDINGDSLVRLLEKAYGLSEPPWHLGEEDALRQAASEAGKASIAAARASLPPQRLRKHKLGPPGAGIGRVWKARNFPGPPGGAPPNEYVYVLNSHVVNTTTPSASEIATAKERLGNNFVVGLTEQMPSFLVLVAVELGWPLKYLCCVARNVNAATGSNKARLPDAIFKHAEKKLFADLELYREAEALHSRQVQAAGVRHATALARFTDPAFGKLVCGHDLSEE